MKTIDMKKALATIPPASPAPQATNEPFDFAAAIGQTAACVVTTVTDIAPSVAGFFDAVGVNYRFTRAVHEGTIPDPAALPATPRITRTRRA